MSKQDARELLVRGNDADDDEEHLRYLKEGGGPMRPREEQMVRGRRPHHRSSDIDRLIRWSD